MRYPTINSESFSSMRNALRLLNLFTMDEPELNLSQLAEKLHVGLSTAYRLTATLMKEGFLVKDPVSKNFRLGASILGMGNTILSRIDLCRCSSAIIEKLSRETGETAHLSIMRKNQVVYLQKVDSPHTVNLLSHVGRKNPVHCTSTGQVILAYQPEAVIDEVIEMGLTRHTSKTITSPVELKKLLGTIREQDYALSIEELHEGISSIAAPVKKASGQVIASISIAGPTSRIQSPRIPQLIKLVKRAAMEVAKEAD